MKRYLPAAAVVLVLLLPLKAMAQTEEPPVSTLVPVSGRIVNRTQGGQVPAGLPVMLHVFDESFANLGMLHGESDEEGRFFFEEVPFEPGLQYAAMVVYEEATYFSDPVAAVEGEPIPAIEVSIYDTTTDTGSLSIDSLHVFFDFEAGGLVVGEVYTLSNRGDRTIAGAVDRQDGVKGTLEFFLPEGASNVHFPNAPEGRFAQVSGGFVDTQPLTPGERMGHVIASYALPYEEGLLFEHPVPYGIKTVSLLMPHGLGIELSAEGMQEEGVQTLGDGQAFEIFTLPALEPGANISVNLSGEAPPAPAVTTTAGLPQAGNERGLVIGAVALGVAMIGAGLWWWRAVSGAPEDDEREDWDLEDAEAPADEFPEE